MAGRIEARPLGAHDIAPLWSLMEGEPKSYMAGFTPFSVFEQFRAAVAEAALDVYRGLWAAESLAGFYMLRGLDAGYARPSFGLYVNSRFAGQGIGTFAVDDALATCRDRHIPTVMLKVAETNTPARKVYERAGFRSIGICPDSGQTVMERSALS
jgi:RimJ/RimL family protein N-acetyltransferase